MKLYIKPNPFSLKRSYEIYDENDKIVYTFNRDSNSTTKEFKLCDLESNELLVVKQEIMKFLPEFDFYVNNVSFAKLKKQFTFFVAKFTLTFNDTNLLTKGNLYHMCFQIYKDSEIISIINRETNKINDIYEIDIFNDNFSAFSCALVAIIDSCTYNFSK